MAIPTSRDVWRCAGCGYVNADAGWCDLCGRGDGEPPAAAATATATSSAPLGPAGVVSAPRTAAASRGVRGVIAFALVAVVANLAVQLGLAELIGRRAAGAAPFLVLLGGGAFYCAAMLGASRVGRRYAVPQRDLGPVGAAVLAGLGRAAPLVAVGALVAVSLPGHRGIDPFAAAVVDDGRAGVVVLAVLVIVLIGPLAEEVIFRGLVAEVLRRHRAPVAVVGSAALFAMAHLNPVRFPYYFAMGVVFGRLYIRRGLLASVVAHSLLNAGVLVIAALVLHGGSAVVTAGGYRVALPDGFHQVGTPPGNLLAATGPGGVAVELASSPIPAGATFDVDLAAGGLDRAPAMGPMRIVPATAHVRLTTFGNGVEAAIAGEGRSGTMVLVADGSHLLVFAAHAPGADADVRGPLEHLLASTSRSSPSD